MRPLSDIKVLDLSRLLPGPFATLVLADLGAQVDKVEDPGGGDYMRHMPPEVAGESASFHLLNRGKRSAVLDLKRAEGREALRKIVRSYDVLFDQFRPGVMDRLGLGHEALRAENPRLVICALTGYGQSGPLAQRAGHDLNYLARAGLLGAQGPVGGPPQPPGFQLADVGGGMWCVIAILAALRERERTGQGAVLDIAMSDSVLGFGTVTLGSMFAEALGPKAAGGSPAAPLGQGTETLTGGIAPYNTYLTSDGQAMALAALEPKFWTAFCTGVGIAPDMSALLAGPHQAALKEQVAALFRSRTREAWVAFAAEHDCCLEPVLHPREVPADPQLAAREVFFEIPSARGATPQVRMPVTPRDGSFTPAPRSGEHTRAILREGGLSDAEIDALIQQGAAKDGAG
ncbi:CaiB/BaiF CoA transferase family protein [Chondromyces apiculatus]|uniref:Alpha-methylacyl-CoA racemase n=1 Tax=Chondromyces apiculatus DSM 436 TaxID=1192034 RepID=A0A017T7J1_9BACT|nr:CaiB/BaiF CoA-transferase family protein [Chondromyces apiculatus]EYF05233.1 Alpha-methylacyl-CoA racemase [Chondromyces apiculatus DSM 436]